jgi:hypothetical protein
MMRIEMVLIATGPHVPQGGYPHAWAAVAADLCSLGLQNKYVLYCGLHA